MADHKEHARKIVLVEVTDGSEGVSRSCGECRKVVIVPTDAQVFADDTQAVCQSCYNRHEAIRLARQAGFRFGL